MNFNFDSDFAKQYGVDEAIMISNFQFWIAKNKANDKHFYDGRFWTYNSTNAFSKLFPFWTERQIKYILKSLIDKKVLMTGNYNKNKYDRTNWYAFVDESVFLDKKISKNDETNLLDTLDKNVQSTLDKNVQPIPDIKPDNKNTDILYTDVSQSKKFLYLGEFKNVKLTLEQIKKLIISYEWYFEDGIETLSSYIACKGDKYKSHYAVLSTHNWVYKEIHKDANCGQRPVCNMIPDPTQKGGLRKETALEYYSKKYGWKFD